mgnify:FL=1
MSRTHNCAAPFDPHLYRYPSRRTVAYAQNGMVCTSVPLAAQAGLDILKKGGNAIDAAIATAMALTVLEPTSNGVGGDAFALVWTKGKLYGINGSGWTPKALNADVIKRMGATAMPRRGWETVLVPGIPSCWAKLTERFGSLSLKDNAAAAIDYARNGYPVSPDVAGFWAADYQEMCKELVGDKYRPWFDTFAPNGVTPEAGSIWKCEDLANTLAEIADTNAESFYRGRLAEKMVDWSRKTGGYLEPDDLSDYQAEWVEPITVNYKGYDVYEIPPNGQGISVLMAMNILKKMELGEQRESVQTYHAMIEAMKLAFTDAKAFVADPRSMKTKVADMLSDKYAARRRAQISQDQAILPTVGAPSCGDTVYLCTADKEGNMVSYIQSNYCDFGSGLVVPGTGILLQNRGSNFSLDPGSDNCIEGRKKSYHTIIPGFLCKDGKAVGPFGVMGGFMQPQGHVQVLVNTIDYHMNPQECLDAPRFQWVGEKRVQVDPWVPEEVVAQLAAMGHDVEVTREPGAMGRGQIIWRTGEHSLAAGTEPRCDGMAAPW